ncbi:7203_t:CDS:2 [Acaulospora morrowiae]|uniref:7203_t:CDS:1 n=1 Tax=Acaulospora morrowiae TaxID=94023 RepID=A0A9N9D615_9GLOM|nr:7203_t:CDS:2 [Acaulospora morrowiae]
MSNYVERVTSQTNSPLMNRTFQEENNMILLASHERSQYLEQIQRMAQPMTSEQVKDLFQGKTFNDRPLPKQNQHENFWINGNVVMNHIA